MPEPSVLVGRAKLPGDKSISHRALLLNAVGEGQAKLRGLNPGADVLSTSRALRRLGVLIRDSGDGCVITGRGGRLRPAADSLDCGNSGTTMRLLAGILAAQPFTTTLDGDASLRSRPMRRVAEPLRALGARVEGPTNGERCPLIITGGSLRAARWDLPVASAQIKSCVLLAAQTAGVEVTVTEPGASRDHTERMLRAMGGRVDADDGTLRLVPADLQCVDVNVPGDPSAAALLAIAVCAVPGSVVRFPDTLLNPTRIGFLDVLRRMGVEVATDGVREKAGEPVGELRLTAPDSLRATNVPTAEIPSLIDEVPALAALAGFATGTTRFDGIAELRVKESDRVQTTLDLLAAFGIRGRVEGDQLAIEGGAPRRPAVVRPAPDHRMVMTACALALASPGDPCVVEGLEHADVSFPGFATTLEELRR